ncbi:hypothetical protein Aph02nite_14990 [Actinoplanes philippinensis]|uniref:Nucleotidyltransferase domain-containing protein n=1 Tax=Actinoplanes philippinensis TaxID=35752 RepID=A0A1I1ZD32_9ACTN|nr:hypothetical protein [Actinoplanes philippinensis]GIE75549.1 hypothetical protein Aph02nite_14990 [Actinoplanes philippinensis]SFE29619.1 hypothetical protein SAMN05421541_10138 [Actinoplanes philippinensis]
MRPVLRRLDEIGTVLSGRGDTIALLGLGSCGAQPARLDDHSDLDFFVVVEDGAAWRYLDRTDWLETPGPVTYLFAHQRGGRRALYADGVLVEYRVLTVADLGRTPFSGARVVWQRPDAPAGLATSGAPVPRPPFDTEDYHLNDALVSLYIGLHRELRGERLAAARLIQHRAVDAVIALLRLGGGEPPYRDAFEPARRIERAYPVEVLPLAAMVPGYTGNVAAARFTFAWLEKRYAVPSGIGIALRELIRSVDA